ncbi:TetR/AcrR family transcriptional regulator [Thauera sinica]|uniref:TetR/AcrR family transcriptional regulator n=1 Tax=Thauera sinica TaxID=2665146 RepID=A0ABW1ANK3_9RHOO|nr:TetR/AcrR family transcriptional regulator [Thauera sp. K11]
MEAAAKLFYERGYEGATVREIAREAGITSGSIFYHFESKEEILAAVLRQGMEEGVAIVRVTVEGVTGARARFDALVLGHLRALHGEKTHFHHIWLQDLRCLPEHMQAPLLELSRDYRALWYQVLDEVKAAGLIRGDKNLFRKVAIGALNWTAQWVHRPRPAQIDELAKAMTRSLLNEPDPTPFRMLEGRDGFSGIAGDGDL